jgi:hypothetical protein
MRAASKLFPTTVYRDQRNRPKTDNSIRVESHRIRIILANHNTVRECHLENEGNLLLVFMETAEEAAKHRIV